MNLRDLYAYAIKRKTALVTGSTAGIGKAIATSLVAEGATVLINGRREENVNETIKEIRAQYPDAILQPVVADLEQNKGAKM